MDFNGTQDNGQTEQNVTEQQNMNNENTATQYSGQQYNPNPYTTTPAYTAEAKQNNGLAIASLVCGIISIVLCCCCGLGVLLGIAGIVLAILSKKNSGGKLSGLAIAGLICGIVGVVFGVGWLIYYLVLGGAATLSDYSNYYGYY